MKTIRIAVIGTRGFPGVQGGVESHCQEIYPRIIPLGCTVTVYGRKGYVNSGLKDYNGVRIIPLWAPRKKSMEAIVHTFWGLLNIFYNRNQYDIVHIHAIGPSLLVPIARLLGLRVVVTNHGPDYKRKKWGGFAKAMLRLGESMGTRFATQVICVSHQIYDLLKKRYGRDSFYIPNGVSMPEKLPPGPALMKYALKPGHYILTVGRLVPEKGFHDLVEVFSEMHTSWKLVIAGGADHEDHYSSSLKKRAQEDSRVVMTGFIKGRPLGEIFSNAGLFVLPSYYEGLPIVLLEALSYGLPVLVSSIPANRELISDESCLFPPGDKWELAQKMSERISNPHCFESISECTKRITSEFDWDTIAKKTFFVYRKALNSF